jgi:long-chain acyl-CoA synthetase
MPASVDYNAYLLEMNMIESPAHILPVAAETYGDKVALITEDAQLSFAELDVRSNQLANALVEMGIQPGDRVSLYSPNCWEWVISYHGILKTGAVVNPINVMLTPEEVEFVANDCGAKLIIGPRDKLEPIVNLVGSGTVEALVCFGDAAPQGTIGFAELIDGQSTEFTVVEIDPAELSTIAYTSGTTGHPKGAMQSHYSVAINCALTALMHGRTHEDSVVSALPCPHVYGNVVMNSAFMTGMTLILHQTFNEEAILQSIQEYSATMFEGVPTMYLFLLSHKKLDDYDLSSLRCCTVGGQTMPIPKMEEVEERFGCPLIELWGMTELAGLGTTFARNGPIKHGSIGVALPYVEARIAAVDDAKKTLTANEPGELMIKGPIVMLGYCGNEDATRETIEPDGWLHTGDIATMDGDGYISIVDRKKDMINTAGFNVYPAELERVIAGHPDVAMVAVGSIRDENKGELAKAYIIAREGTSPEAGKIIDYCREHLAAYKVPRAVQFVDDFPKTSSGKIMRRKLHELDEGQAQVS